MSRDYHFIQYSWPDTGTLSIKTYGNIGAAIRYSPNPEAVECIARDRHCHSLGSNITDHHLIPHRPETSSQGRQLDYRSTEDAYNKVAKSYNAYLRTGKVSEAMFCLGTMAKICVAEGRLFDGVKQYMILLAIGLNQKSPVISVQYASALHDAYDGLTDEKDRATNVLRNDILSSFLWNGSVSASGTFDLIQMVCHGEILEAVKIILLLSGEDPQTVK